MPISRKLTPQPSQLRPKYPVTTMLGVYTAAIAAIIVDVAGTFNSHDETRPIEAQPKGETSVDRVKVLKPEGSGAVPTGGIVTNPSTGDQYPTSITDDRMVLLAPVDNGNPATAGSNPAHQQPTPRSNASRTNADPNQPAAAKQDKPDDRVVTPPPPPQNEQPEPKTREKPPRPGSKPPVKTKPAPE